MNAASIDLDKYLRNFRMFYSKIVTGHPEQVNLEKKFKFLLENQANKWRSSLFTSNTSDTVNTLKSFLNKAKSVAPKSNVKKQKHEWLFQTTNFTRCFVFTCIFSLLDIKSKQGIQMIRAHLENEGVLTDGQMFKGIVFRKILYAWSKIEKLCLNPFNNKPYGPLGECINELPQEFIQVLYDVFVDRKVSRLLLEEIKEDNLALLSDVIKTSLTFFEFQNEKITITRKGGTFKKNVNIGYLPEDKIYVIAKALPKKQSHDGPQYKTLVKLSQVSVDLFKMYETDDIKLRNLDSVLATNPKALQSQKVGTLTHIPPKAVSSSKMMNSTYQSPARTGSGNKMMSSTLGRQSGSSSFLNFRGSSVIMNTSRY